VVTGGREREKEREREREGLWVLIPILMKHLKRIAWDIPIVCLLREINRERKRERWGEKERERWKKRKKEREMGREI
jgi:hypothetical protein